MRCKRVETDLFAFQDFFKFPLYPLHRDVSHTAAAAAALAVAPLCVRVHVRVREETPPLLSSPLLSGSNAVSV